MYLFKNSLNNWIFGGTPASICPAGAYRIEPNSDRSAVSIISISGDMIVHRLIPVTKFLDATGTPYTDWAAFLAATAGFFNAPLASALNNGEMSVSVNEPITIEEAEGTETSQSISLATVRYWPSAAGVKMNRDKITCKLKSTNLSGDTTVTPQFAMSDGEFADGESNLEVITHTFKNNTAFKQTYEADRGDYFRLAFAGVTTGDVAGKLRN